MTLSLMFLLDVIAIVVVVFVLDELASAGELAAGRVELVAELDRGRGRSVSHGW